LLRGGEKKNVLSNPSKDGSKHRKGLRGRKKAEKIMILLRKERLLAHEKKISVEKEVRKPSGTKRKEETKVYRLFSRKRKNPNGERGKRERECRIYAQGKRGGKKQVYFSDGVRGRTIYSSSSGARKGKVKGGRQLSYYTSGRRRQVYPESCLRKRISFKKRRKQEGFDFL